ncbi:type VII secretion integral membrane protein EccD [Nocardiopsis gilva YIM 90087]|uniref:Type VII secretion integral membrane protein EccD n=1 Tax=Nocardiopsis gilva YIM 90087 TaxID=1235441 RepID=A0A223S6I8_9ACTN|nr:type VII secretion integral membrane protein EccD [Nocardiopsis gilva]ASU83740.1 type VII secretion integral membrane protein EccD [Nocardiopsis gilva YIM 90087]
MSGYCRVTVTGPQRWADLVLPGTVPVATLMPQVLRVCSTDTDRLEPVGWNLTTADGTAVRPDATLQKAGVRDGDVLLLSSQPPRDRPAFVDDVRGAVEDRVDETGSVWRPSTTLAFGVALLVIVPMAVMIVMAAFFRFSAIDLVTAPLGVVVSLGAMWLAVRRSMAGVAHASLAAACGWGAMIAVAASYVLSGAEPPPPAVPAVFAVVGALVVVGLASVIHQTALPYLAALGVLTVAAAVLVAVGLFVDGAQGARTVAVLLTLGVGVMPRMAMSMGGLSGLDYEVRHSGQAPAERFDRTMRLTDRLLLGLVIGAALATTATVPLLIFTGAGWRDLVLAALVSLLLVMRSRLFDRIRHVLPLRVGGVLGFVIVGVGLVLMLPPLEGWLPLLALMVCVTVAGLSWIDLPDVPRASLRRVLNGVEVAAIVAFCAAAAWALGVFDLVTSLTA